jgi:hypothetical protein
MAYTWPGRRAAIDKFPAAELLHRASYIRMPRQFVCALCLVACSVLARAQSKDVQIPRIAQPFLAAGSEWQAEITLRPVSRMKLEGIYFLTRLRTLAREGIFTNHLARSRLNYQFTRALSLRMILDYNSVLENPRLINLTRQKRITGDVLLTYLLHPGTAIYAGYTDRLENLAVGPDNSLIRTAQPYTTVGRQFFMKASYLFRF